MQRIGEKLRTLRVQHGISQRELGRQLGIASSYMSYIENGTIKPNIPYILKIADYFGVSVDALVLDELELDDGG
jgi:transcriptional regulator with XRE-family HTH domain